MAIIEMPLYEPTRSLNEYCSGFTSAKFSVLLTCCFMFVANVG